MKRNYPHLWTMLAKLPGIPEENKERLIKEITQGRTISLHEISDNEYSRLVLKLANIITENKPRETREEREYRVMRLLKVNRDTYNQWIFDWAYVYLNEKFGDAGMVELYSNTQGFWSWWINQFDLANGRFLFFYQAYNLKDKSLSELIETYRIMHIKIKAIPTNLINRIDKLKLKIDV